MVRVSSQFASLELSRRMSRALLVLHKYNGHLGEAEIEVH